MKAFTEFVLRSRKHAILMALLFSFLPLLGWIGAVIIGIVTLRYGAIEGLWVMLVTLLPSALFLLMGQTSPILFNLVFGSMFLWVIATVLRSQISWLMVLRATVIWGALIVVIAHIASPDIHQWWTAKFDSYFTQLMTAAKATGETAKIQEIQQYIDFIKQPQVFGSILKIITGLFTTFLLSISLFNLLIARWCQANTFNPGGLKKELLQIRLTVTESIIFAAILLGLLLKINIIWDLVPVLCLPFIVASLSLIHRMAMQTKTWWLWLGIFYLLLILIFPIMLKILVLLAVADSIFNFRAKMPPLSGTA